MSEERRKVVYHGIDDIYQDLGDLSSIRNNGDDHQDDLGGSDTDSHVRRAIDINSKSSFNSNTHSSSYINNDSEIANNRDDTSMSSDNDTNNYNSNSNFNYNHSSNRNKSNYNNNDKSKQRNKSASRESSVHDSQMMQSGDNTYPYQHQHQHHSDLDEQGNARPEYDPSKPFAFSSDSDDSETENEQSIPITAADAPLLSLIDQLNTDLSQDHQLDEQNIQKILELFDDIAKQYKASTKKTLFSRKIKRLYKNAVTKLPNITSLYQMYRDFKLLNKLNSLAAPTVKVVKFMPDMFKLPATPKPMQYNNGITHDSKQSTLQFKHTSVPVDLTFKDLQYFKSVSKMLTSKAQEKSKDSKKEKKLKMPNSNEHHSNNAGNTNITNTNTNTNTYDKLNEIYSQNTNYNDNNSYNNQYNNDSTMNIDSKQQPASSSPSPSPLPSQSSSPSSSPSSLHFPVPAPVSVPSPLPSQSPSPSSSPLSQPKPTEILSPQKQQHILEKEKEKDSPADHSNDVNSNNRSSMDPPASDDENAKQNEEKIVTMPVGTPIPLFALQKKSTPSSATVDEKSVTKEASASFQLDSKLLDSLTPNEKDTLMLQKNIAQLAIPSSDGSTLDINSDNIINRLMAMASNQQVIGQVQTLYASQQTFEQRMIGERMKILEMSQLSKRKLHNDFQQLQNQATNNMAKYQIYENYQMQEQMINEDVENKLNELSKIIMGQYIQMIHMHQNALQQLGVIGIFPTQNTNQIKQQIKILEILFPSIYK